MSTFVSRINNYFNPPQVVPVAPLSSLDPLSPEWMQRAIESLRELFPLYPCVGNRNNGSYVNEREMKITQIRVEESLVVLNTEFRVLTNASDVVENNIKRVVSENIKAFFTKLGITDFYGEGNELKADAAQGCNAYGRLSDYKNVDISSLGAGFKHNLISLSLAVHKDSLQEALQADRSAPPVKKAWMIF